MTKTEYASYLTTDHWRDIRTEMIEAWPFCEHCKMPRWLAEIAYDQDLHVHHLTYARIGCEEIEDLATLCRRCHEIETFGRSELRAPKQAKCQLCMSTHWNYRSDFCPTCVLVLMEPYLSFIFDQPHPFKSDVVMAEDIKRQVTPPTWLTEG